MMLSNRPSGKQPAFASWLSDYIFIVRNRRGKKKAKKQLSLPVSRKIKQQALSSFLLPRRCPPGRQGAVCGGAGAAGDSAPWRPGGERRLGDKMAAAAGSGAGSGAGRAAARARPGPARFRGCLAGALLGDCLGAVFEGRSVVKLPDLLSFLRGLEPAAGPAEEGEAAGSARRGGGSLVSGTGVWPAAHPVPCTHRLPNPSRFGPNAPGIGLWGACPPRPCSPRPGFPAPCPSPRPGHLPGDTRAAPSPAVPCPLRCRFVTPALAPPDCSCFLKHVWKDVGHYARARGCQRGTDVPKIDKD